MSLAGETSEMKVSGYIGVFLKTPVSENMAAGSLFLFRIKRDLVYQVQRLFNVSTVLAVLPFNAYIKYKCITCMYVCIYVCIYILYM